MELLDELFDLPEAERELRLQRVDPDIRVEARKLLAADAGADHALSEIVARNLPEALQEVLARSASPAGTTVGPFRLVRLLGEGGMGEVWLGERENADFQQRVAVKLLSMGRDKAALGFRFLQERRILARLTHPRIARLLDGGVTAEGRPWLAMELVEGLTLTQHCAAKRLGVKERLGLFLEACDAVQFAHHNLVIHRDLKPSNILVGPNGEVKLLDFGIAKLLEGDDDGSPTLTRAGEQPMTPQYAAPEQVQGGIATTATDVWALGVILHELLTGAHPFESQKKRRDIERAILEATPSRPSSRTNAVESTGWPAGTSPRLLRKHLQGDLDAIVLKALRRNPEDRYPSAEALAADVRRQLSGHPVEARGDAASYLLRSFVRRHRVGVASTLLALGTLLAGLIGTLWEAHRAREEARRAEQTQDFLVSMVAGFDPYQRGSEPTQQAILTDAEARVDTLDAPPEVKARLLRVFAQTWCNLGKLERAKAAAHRALTMERAALGPRSIEVAKTLIVLGKVADLEIDPAAGGPAYEEALAIAREVEGPDGSTALEALGGVALMARRRGDFPLSERLYSEQVERCRRLRGPEDPDTVMALGDYAQPIYEMGRVEESLDLYRRTALLQAKLRGEEHPETLLARTNLARALVDLARFEEADAILKDVSERQARIIGKDAPYALYTELVRGRALDGLGRPGEAVPLFERGIPLDGTESLGAAQVLAYESRALLHLGRAGDAEAAARRALAIDVPRLGENHVTARARSALGSALLEQGRIDEARSELSRALAVQEKLLFSTSPDLKATRAELTRVAAASQR
jgi:serine/threonine-protein kinase